MKTEAQTLKRWQKALLALNIFLSVVAAALYFGAERLAAPPRPPQEVQFAAPRLTALTDLDGAPVSLEAYRGSVILVNLWATWCPPCREEMPALESFYRKYKDEGFALLAVNQREARETVVSFAAEYGLTFPIWLDPGGEAAEKFRAYALPVSYLLDREGRARWVWMGGVREAQLKKYVLKILYESQE